MPTNSQRREAAKRKLQRQLARREERDRARRQRLVIVGVVAAVLVISGGIWWVVSGRSSSTASSDTTSSTDASATETSPSAPTTPCSYPASGTAAKPVTPPDNLSPLNAGTVQADLTINGSAVPVTLDRALAPCGVNAFLSLAQQGFYNDTTCHRLTVSGALNILQCGDPTGKGNGGPGYSFATEVATTATYPVGTLALANAGASAGDSNGSQFFIVYGPTTLDPSYTILGTVSADGMKVINQIAAGGTEGGGQEGKPKTTATIQTVTVPPDALEGTGTYATQTPASDATDAVPTDTAAPTSTAPAATDTAVPTTSGGAG